MINHACLAAVVLMTGSVTGGVALGNYATGSWKLQHGSIIDEPIFTADGFATEQDGSIALIAPDSTGPHVCQGCDAGKHLRGRWQDQRADAYDQDYPDYTPPIAPDAYSVDPDWGGGAPPRVEKARYSVLEVASPEAPAPTNPVKDETPVREATVMASATPPPLPILASAVGAAAPN